MIGSIERLRRLGQVSRVAPVMLLVIGIPSHPDPINKRVTGTAGILPIPAAPATSSNTRSELIAPENRRDARAERGRVLYADGRASRDSAETRAVRHHLCPDQRVVQTRTSANPTS